MKRHLRIVIEAGEHTCRATSTGPWCQFVCVSGWGQSHLCGLFGKTLPEVNYDGTPSEGIAWSGRLPECKAAEGAS